MAAKPTDLPEWATDPGADVETPPPGKQASGWTPLEKPPHQWFNWLFLLIYRWLAYFEDWTDSHDHRGLAATGSRPKIDPEDEVDWGTFLGVDKAAGRLRSSESRTDRLVPNPGGADLILVQDSTSKLAPILAQNTPNAWGRISATGAVQSGFRIAAVTKVSTGVFEVEFTGIVDLADAVVAVTPIFQSMGGAVTPSPVVMDVFAAATMDKVTVGIYDASTLAATDRSFSILVHVKP